MQRRKNDESGRDYANLRRPTEYQPEHRRRPRRILMVDPSRVDRLLVSTALTLKGRDDVRLTEVADFDLGLSLLLQRTYDLVLLDDAVPGLSPGETIRAIRGVAPATPIVRHAAYLEAPSENGNGLDQLVEAVEAALAEAAAVDAAGTAAMPFSASAPWSAASAES
jgi:CheY-like chemotaxis protein